MSSVSYRGGGASGMKIARIVVPWAVLALVMVSVMSMFGQYRAASEEYAQRNDRSLALTGTVPPAELKRQQQVKLQKEKAAREVAAKKAAGPSLKVITNGLNFRSGPSGSSKVLRTLRKGEALTVLQSSGSWYRAKDGKGEEGWVTSSTRFVKVDK